MKIGSSFHLKFWLHLSFRSLRMYFLYWHKLSLDCFLLATFLVFYYSSFFSLCFIFRGYVIGSLLNCCPISLIFSFHFANRFCHAKVVLFREQCQCTNKHINRIFFINIYQLHIS